MASTPILSLFLPEYLSPSQNQWERMHHRSRTKAKQDVATRIIVAFNTIKTSYRWANWEPVVCVYTRKRRRGRDLDDDNLAGSFKAIGDGLEMAALIRDDKQIRLQCKQECVGMKGDWGTRLDFYIPSVCESCGQIVPIDDEALAEQSRQG